ncbi:hypothetical protein RCL1_000936 [Eukaryota sp. TZLM3-RCL]
MSSTTHEVDESLYSRSLYVLGHDALKKMSQSNVLISGMTGVGAEIAKNLILSGVKSVTIHDLHDVRPGDLGSNFYLTQESIGSNRALACYKKFKTLNAYVEVNVNTSPLTEPLISQFSVVVLTNSAEEEYTTVSQICRHHGVKFIIADSRGVTGRVFCDFGDSHTVVDPDGESMPTYALANIEQAADGSTVAYIADDHSERITWSNGGSVKFSGVVGFPELENLEIKTEVLSPFSFRIPLTITSSSKFISGYVTPCKDVITMSFESYNQQMVKPSLTGLIGSTLEAELLHLIYLSIDSFNSQQKRLPTVDNQSDLILLMNILDTINTRFNLFPRARDEKVRLLLSKLLPVCASELSPVSAVIGGIAAQEVLKAVSGKFMPITQFFYFDCVEVLPDHEIPINERLPIGSRHDDQISIFGTSLQQKFADLRMFLVGAGAIGCEVLKSIAMMGIGTSERGKIVVTDMDTIEKSNLNRQFLFSFEDINKFKSEVAARVAKEMNPEINIFPTQIPVGPETESMYNDEFFEQIDLICNALDNIKARLYMDSKAVYYAKPLLESGTLGTKANVQVVIPYLTKSYGETQDPPEKSVPMCTLKNFPYQIEHTIEWSRQLFEELFLNPVVDAEKYLKNQSYLIELKNEGIQSIPNLLNIKQYLVDVRPNSFDDCIKFARLKFEELFNHSIKQWLFMFPADAVTEAGTPFWSGSKRAPTPVDFDPNNEYHVNFILFGAKIFAEIYGIPVVFDPQYVINRALSVPVPSFVPQSDVQVDLEDKSVETTRPTQSNISIDDVIQSIPPPQATGLTHLQPIELDKDKDELGHIDFITACSNIRASNYYIPSVDKHRTRGIAGKIVPAMITTTALVVGLVGIELYKLAQGKKRLDDYCDSFLNLALPFIARSTPAEAVKAEMMGQSFSIWDKLFFDCGDVTLDAFVKLFEAKYNLSVCMITIDQFMVFSVYMPNKAQQERMNKPLSSVYEEFNKKPMPVGSKYINMVVMAVDEQDMDVDCPLCVVKVR